MLKEKWIISVGGGYGEFEFIGTEIEAEEMRHNKSRWEGAVATKCRLTPLAPDACPYCFGKGEELAKKVMVRCRFCAGTGKRQ